MARLNIVEALNSALKEEMARDPAVMLLGEDVGEDGGVFRVTEGLHQLYGSQRVYDTPLAESGIVGVSVGLALAGMKPVAEIQFDGFTFPILDQVVNHVGRMRSRTRGRHHLQMVVRFPYGAGIKGVEHHSESPEAYFARTPGVKVVIPSNPYDAKGLVLAAIRDPDPVIFMEPKRIYRAFRQEVPEGDYTVPLCQAQVVREGKDVTLIAWGAMVREALQAAEKVQRQMSCEVVDVRTLSPLDLPTLEASVKKTGRAVVIQEAPRNCGVAAEIAALLGERLFFSLESPIRRVTGWDVVMPYPKLEPYYLVSSDRIVQVLETLREAKPVA